MIALPMRDGKYIWSGTGGKFEWALILGSLPTRADYEFLEATLALAVVTIKCGMIQAECRFTGFDDIPEPPKTTEEATL